MAYAIVIFLIILTGALMATKADLDAALDALSAKVDQKSADVLVALNALNQAQDLAAEVAKANDIAAKVDAIPTAPTV